MTQYYPIRIVRLVTGETLVTGISMKENSNYILERPMVLVTVPKMIQEGTNVVQQVGTALKDWIDFTCDDYFMVKKDLVATIARPVQDLVSDYTQAKIRNDIIRSEMNGNFGEDSSLIEDFPDESDENDEFPGWGGNPRLGT